MFTCKKISLLCTNQVSKLSIMVTLDFPSAPFMGKLKEEKKKFLIVCFPPYLLYLHAPDNLKSQ